MAYTDSKKDEHIIDCVLRQNAELFQNLGTDSSKTEYKKAKVSERNKLRNIRDIDPEKIDRLINDSLND